MSWLALFFALEVGIIPNGAFLMYDKEPAPFVVNGSLYLYDITEQRLDWTLFTELETEVTLFDLIYLGGSVKTPMIWNGDYTFSPNALFYDWRAGLRFGPVDIFWRHYCRHPLMTYMFAYTANLRWEGGYDEIGIRLELSTP